MKYSQILFFNSLIIGTLISVSSFSWFSMWMGLELNLLSFIPLMNLSKDKFSSEASLKYFIVQALSSMVILFSILVSLVKNDFFLNLETPMNLMLSSAFLTKMGMAPFHFWFPEIMEGVTWEISFILLTWQKVAPMMLLLYNFFLNTFFYFIIITGMIVSGIKNFNMTSLKKFLVFSSINHMSWMLSVLFLNQSIWMIYFLTYSFLNFSIISLFKTLNLANFNQIFQVLNSKKWLKLNFFLTFFSLGGLPPFLGFFPKWLIISVLLDTKMIFLTLIMVILTLLTLFVYIRLSIQSMILTSTEKKMIKAFKLEKKIFISNFFNIFGLVLFTLVFNF
uniref:NADH-ubiquinone oxidoreductase chain 2 n=1 Tax=Cucujoidea sp. 42 KM-2017 TaxID=2219381 RepID=A0A346RJ04_9CUCU|nr:NADH dehydrogenase subunit 2 [Cucujoidea sp. 42 KM-2017]